ncbi:hypothetical protein COS33_01150 [Candidatus Wolfebacteria bacterium CG02_land_8_20_14_3_00_37_12]|uniref:Uncharacterized protein n=3 Tax=Candidatus Wolfeibacteriota TaxID=1752735 RepID=A0A2M7Q896_9BACT|nr:MAG: hypothetical protein COS33_01150 [Candidatus Wolfebacteria bacterium CG02_land_8_20_14_3_00_37_12]PIY59285.1 MAG: hypothetical protein COY96_02665 [Candidatus Wolfebacteria bacterium CG_4_10_14_0_8_um_filter_37_11]PJA41829.1 MAG: hypothetical protein CO177_00360 [Candidatus Wolfebacteria bacterium CG_4_9_14_3_um_filter_37_9]
MNTLILEKKIQKIAEKTAQKVVLKMFQNIFEEKKTDIDSLSLLVQKGGSFNFLFNEPNLYSIKDIKK